MTTPFAPLISILMPAYNCGAFIGKTIESVKAQTEQGWELIIVDDCSRDNTLSVAQQYAQQDARIRVLSNGQNLGMLGNWNYGISLCDAPLFVKLDADDIWHPQMLEKAMAVLESHPQVGLVFSRYVNIDEHGREMPGTDIPLPEFATNKSFSCIPLVRQGPGKMLSYPILRQGLSVMRRKIFDEIGAYRHLLNKDTQASTDTEFYFRLGAHHDIYCIDEVLYQYRVHAASISATDTASKLADQKLFEIKYCIVDYYTRQGFLPEHTGRQYLQQIETLYNLQQTAFYRNSGDARRAISILGKSLLKSPAAVMKFYANRIFQKMAGHE